MQDGKVYESPHVFASICDPRFKNLYNFPESFKKRSYDAFKDFMNKNFNHYTPNVIEPNPSAKLHKLFDKVKTFKIPSTTKEEFQSYVH